VIAHNQITHGPDWPTGVNGFRAWTAPTKFAGFVPCPCGWSGLKHYAAREYVEAYRANPAGYKRRVKYQERQWRAGTLLTDDAWSDTL
jgi:hypothetical protein